MVDRPLRVHVLSDGRAGHYNQSRGIIKALQQHRQLEVHWVSLKLRAGFMRSLLRAMLNQVKTPPPLRWLKLFYRIEDFSAGCCDLIVSTGGRTSFASAWLASELRVPNIYAGSLRGLSHKLFSVVLTLERLREADNNLVLRLPPSPVEPELLQQQAMDFYSTHSEEGQRYWSLLLGGDGAGFHYRRRDWDRLVRLMRLLAEQHDIRWLLATSPRTGSSVERFFRDSLEPGICAAESWFGRGDGYHPGIWLGAAERVFVTEDSMTMLTEAMYSQKPVYSLRPTRAMPNERYQHALQSFCNQGLLCRHHIRRLLHHPDELERQSCQPMQESPLPALGKQLLERLPL